MGCPCCHCLGALGWTEDRRSTRPGLLCHLSGHSSPAAGVEDQTQLLAGPVLRARAQQARPCAPDACAQRTVPWSSIRELTARRASDTACGPSPEALLWRAPGSNLPPGAEHGGGFCDAENKQDVVHALSTHPNTTTGQPDEHGGQRACGDRERSGGHPALEVAPPKQAEAGLGPALARGATPTPWCLARAQS